MADGSHVENGGITPEATYSEASVPIMTELDNDIFPYATANNLKATNSPTSGVKATTFRIDSNPEEQGTDDSNKQITMNGVVYSVPFKKRKAENPNVPPKPTEKVAVFDDDTELWENNVYHKTTL